MLARVAHPSLAFASKVLKTKQGVVFSFWLVVSTHLKNISQIGSSSPNRGENIEYLKPPPSFWLVRKRSGTMFFFVSGAPKEQQNMSPRQANQKN